MKRIRVLALAPVVVALVIAGCGGSSGGSSTAGTSSGGAKADTTVELRKLNVGPALVDGAGRTLYLFEADKTDKSTCSGACASLWPPDTVTAKPKAGPGVDAAKLGTTKRSDGTLEATYNGHPLYFYAPDTQPGQDTGQGLNQFGAKWYVIASSGAKIDSD